MKRTLAGLAAAILLPAGIVAALATPAAAGPAPAAPTATADAASPAMLAALQRDLGLTAAQARERITRDAAATATELKLRKQLGTAFAGAWLTADASSLVVAVTDSRRAAEVRAAGATPTVVARSAATLDAVKAGLDRAATRAPAASVPGWYVDVRTNSVVVLARGGTAAASAFVRASGVAAGAVRIVASTEVPRTLYDVRGGDAFYIGGGRCSIGFSVNGGYVTAGHCGSAGQATSGYNQVAQGTFQASSFPGNDYSWVAVNSNWIPQPWVNNYSGGNVTVAGSTEAAVGAAICRSGSTTGWHCGSIQAKNQTVNYAQGVTSGGSGNCTSGGTTYFQPVNEILTAYGRTLVTSGSPPPPPPPGGCSGYEFTTTGSVSSGGSQWTPYYYSSVSGTHRGCLDGPTGVDFDLYLQKWNGYYWADVAAGTSPNPDETVSYTGTAGYYRWEVYAYSGSGSYSLGYSNP